MKKVKGIVILKKSDTWQLKVFDEKRIISECLEQWHKTDTAQAIELSIEIKSPFQFKTQSQLGYLHASVYATIINAMRGWGNEMTKDEGVNYLKNQVKFIGEEVNKVTGETQPCLKSCSTASKEELGEYIDRLIRWAGEWGIRVETPEEYKKRLNIKDFK